MFDKLFTPIKIRDLELRNRVIMSGMGTHLANPGTSEVSDRLIQYHAARARGGVAVNFTECCSVDAASSPRGFIAISEDKYIPGMRRLADAIHAEGGRLGVQLWQGSLAVGSDPQAQILMVNDTPFTPEFTMPAITEERIWSIIEAYGKAAARCVEAGADILEFHCGHNYLPHSFLSAGLNYRQDSWGGSLENRMKFPLLCIEAIRRNIPEGMPLTMRVDCHDDYLPNGLTEEDIITFCKAAGEKGVDVLNISRGNIISGIGQIFETPPVDLPNGFNVEPAARIRKGTGMLVMPAGRINTPQMAEQILEEDKADLVIMSRAQIADPEFCHKAQAGQLSSIKYCTGCDQGCYGYFFRSLSDPSYHISCMRNPATGEEATMSLKPAAEPKKVLVAGGGIAGVEATDWLMTRGHKPVLYEATDHLGGQFELAGVTPRKGDYVMAAKMAVQNIIDRSAEIHMNSAVIPETVEAEKPDAVIVAIGSAPVIPRIPGIEGKNVMEAHEALSGKEFTPGKAVVIGGGLVGIELSEFLNEKGCSVTVVEMKDSILGDLVDLRQMFTKMSLEQRQIQVLLNTACKEIREDSVIIDQQGEEKALEADLVFLAIGSRARPSDDIQAKCKEMNIPCYVVGDAKEARLALDALEEAYRAVLDIN